MLSLQRLPGWKAGPWEGLQSSGGRRRENPNVGCLGMEVAPAALLRCPSSIILPVCVRKVGSCRAGAAPTPAWTLKVLGCKAMLSSCFFRFLEACRNRSWAKIL